MEQKDERLWRIAQQRAGFRRSLYSFLVVILFLWGIWWFTSGEHYFESGRRWVPWPCWVMLGWGLGLGLQYFRAYHGSKEDLAEEEYRRMKDQQS